MSALGLTPELLARLQRIAAAEKKPIAQVLCDAVLAHWVKFAARNKLKEW